MLTCLASLDFHQIMMESLLWNAFMLVGGVAIGAAAVRRSE